MIRTPRWIALALVVAAALAGLPAGDGFQVLGAGKPLGAFALSRPGPSTQNPAPSCIDEVIARGDSFTRFQIMEPALPWQGFDFLLLYTGKTFAGLDRPRPFPHYVALFQREGSLRAFAALKEMGSYEDQVSVTLVHLSRTR